MRAVAKPPRVCLGRARARGATPRCRPLRHAAVAEQSGEDWRAFRAQLVANEHCLLGRGSQAGRVCGVPAEASFSAQHWAHALPKVRDATAAQQLQRAAGPPSPRAGATGAERAPLGRHISPLCLRRAHEGARGRWGASVA